MENHEIEKAEKQIRSAWIVGLISTGLTLIVALIGTYNDDFRYSSGFDAWNLVDAALLAALSYGVYKKSRYSALALLVYFVLSKLMAVAEEGRFSGGAISLLFGYYFIMGTMATFRLHKHHQQEASEIAVKKRGIVFYASAGVGIVLLLSFAALMIFAAMGPGTEVIPGKQLKAQYVNFAVAEGMLEEKEQIQFWYSDGFSDYKDGFYFFTDQKVVMYNQSWEEPAILVPLATIEEIDFMHEPSFTEDSQILLYLLDGSFLSFPVSSENGGDERFYNRLKQLWSLTEKISASEPPAGADVEQQSL